MTERLLDFARRLAAGTSQFDFGAEDNAAICAAFGVRQEYLGRKAGWKRWHPDSRRWGSTLRPASSLDDLAALLRQADRIRPGHTFDVRPWVAASRELLVLSGEGK